MNLFASKKRAHFEISPPTFWKQELEHSLKLSEAKQCDLFPLMRTVLNQDDDQSWQHHYQQLTPSN